MFLQGATWAVLNSSATTDAPAILVSASTLLNDNAALLRMCQNLLTPIRKQCPLHSLLSGDYQGSQLCMVTAHPEFSSAVCTGAAAGALGKPEYSFSLFTLANQVWVLLRTILEVLHFFVALTLQWSTPAQTHKHWVSPRLLSQSMNIDKHTRTNWLACEKNS